MTHEGYRLVDVVQRSIDRPIPPQLARDGLHPDDRVSLIFLGDGDLGERARASAMVRADNLIIFAADGRFGERAWVRVTHVVRADDRIVAYDGTLESQPAFIDGVHCGDNVRFLPKHVADIDVAGLPS